MFTHKLMKFQISLILLVLLLVGCSTTPKIEPTVTPTLAQIETAAPTEVISETPTTVDEKYTPPSVDICPMIQQEAVNALGVQFILESDAPFQDSLTGETGSGCKITATGDGTNFSSSQDVVRTLINTAALGWSEQTDYQADGPTGSSTALIRDMTLMIIYAGWEPAEGVVCPDDQPISQCVLTPEQKNYTVEINIAEYHVDFSLDGHWVDATTGFTLDLYQDWKNIWGQHEVVAQGGNKIDALEASINGTLQGKVARVTFQSSFTSETGTAEITYIDVNTIQWKIIESPDGEFYLPAEATLKR